MNKILEIIHNADSLLIGAGAGLSTAAGIDYAGPKFQAEFKEFIQKYGFTDLYTSSFYDFPSQQAYWAYWAKHIAFANLHQEGTALYKNIFAAVQHKPYFVITTNVDDQFYKTGFAENRIFRVQGSYRYIQCARACHNQLYDDAALVENMLPRIDSQLQIPAELVPKCPVCGENMEPNLRKDANFVQDDLWYRQSAAYENFLAENKHKKVVLLEFGVGFNTPGIIRIPFERFVLQNKNWTLVRLNKDTRSYCLLDDRLIAAKEDINQIFQDEEVRK